MDLPREDRFPVQLLPKINITNDDTPAGRYYYRPDCHPEVRYQSVTTRIGNSDVFDKTWLDKWRADIGPEVAGYITRNAGERGTLLHDSIEKFLLGAEFSTRHLPDDVGTMLDQGLPILKQNINLVYGTEYGLWSDRLRTAGKTDLLGQWNGVPFVGDHKTSRKEKKPVDIINYFVQVTAYGIMATEQTGIPFEYGIVFMYSDSEFEPFRMHKFKLAKYRALTEQIFTSIQGQGAPGS